MPRRKRNRTPNLKILILCEGQTERNYLLEIKNTLPREKQRGISIDIERFKRNDPLSLVNEANRRKQIARAEGVRFDHIWVVFDNDNLPNRDKAFYRANKYGLKIAYSSFNIEVWFIIHFEYTTRQFNNGNSVKNYLKSKYIQNYEPGKTLLLDQLDPLYDDALQNAKRIRSLHQDDIDSNNAKIWEINPYVTIDLLTEFLIKLGK
jgi:hypothetical protein